MSSGEKTPAEVGTSGKSKPVASADEKVVAGVDPKSAPPEQLEQLRRRQHALTGEVNFVQEEDVRLETTRVRLLNVQKRHEALKDRLSRDSDKMIFERLQKEFEAARVAQTEEISLEGEQWNDGLLATVREKTRYTWKWIGRQCQVKQASRWILNLMLKLHTG